MALTISAAIRTSLETTLRVKHNLTLRERVASPSAKCTQRKTQLHSGKSSPSATLREESPGYLFTGKTSSSRAENRALGEDFPESRSSTRGGNVEWQPMYVLTDLL